MLYRANGQFKTRYEADQQIFPIRQDRIGIGLLIAFAAVAVPMLASDYMFRAIDFLINVSNGSGYQTRGLSEAEISKRLGHTLGQQGGREVTFWFELIIGFLCSPTGTQDMCLLNPYIQDAAMIENLTAGILLTVNRLAQVRPLGSRA